MTVAITSSINHSVALVKAALSANLINVVAETFTPAGDPTDPFQMVLRSLFGTHAYAWYSIDQSGPVVRVTFTNKEKPRVLTFQGMPAQIASGDTEAFELRLQESDIVRPGRIPVHRTNPRLLKE